MKSKKIYGVSGLLEWQCLIVSNGVRFHFPFADGAITAYGVTQARYATDNPIFQSVIENSDLFKKGRITLVRTIPLEAEVKKEEVIAPTPAPVQTQVVSAPSLEDAKQYLVDHFGIDPTTLTSKRSINKAATEHNITFEGI